MMGEDALESDMLHDSAGPGGTEPIIGRSMSSAEILGHLGRHGCKDITDQLDMSKVGPAAVSTGGLGDVYRGVLRNGVQVAIKRLRMQIDDTKQLKHAAHELYVWAKCKHPNILELIGVAEYNDRIAMVSPWMMNGNLSRYLARHPQADRYNLCSQVADAAAYLKECGMVHGDIKCANIVVSEEHVPKLTDFGSSILSSYTLSFTATTAEPQMTLRWAAPEVFHGETSHTHESDVYALGMTILEIVTGSVPYEGLQDQAVMGRLFRRAHPDRPQQHIPTGKVSSALLWSLLKSCWDNKPQNRPSAQWVRDELIALMGVQGLDHGLTAGQMSPDQSQNTNTGGASTEFDIHVEVAKLSHDPPKLRQYFDGIFSSLVRLDGLSVAARLPTAFAAWLGLRSPTSSTEWNGIREGYNNILEDSRALGVEIETRAKEFRAEIIPLVRNTSVPSTEKMASVRRFLTNIQPFQGAAEKMSRRFGHIESRILEFQEIYEDEIDKGINDIDQKIRGVKTRIGGLVRKIDESESQDEISQTRLDLSKTLTGLKALEADISNLELLTSSGVESARLNTDRACGRLSAASKVWEAFRKEIQLLHVCIGYDSIACPRGSQAFSAMMSDEKIIVPLYTKLENLLCTYNNVVP